MKNLIDHFITNRKQNFGIEVNQEGSWFIFLNLYWWSFTFDCCSSTDYAFGYTELEFCNEIKRINYAFIAGYSHVTNKIRWTFHRFDLCPTNK